MKTIRNHHCKFICLKKFFRRVEYKIQPGESAPTSEAEHFPCSRGGASASPPSQPNIHSLVAQLNSALRGDKLVCKMFLYMSIKCGEIPFVWKGVSLAEFKQGSSWQNRFLK